MNEAETLARMVAPGTRRRGKYREGVIQVHVTRACDKSCFACTQGSNLGGKYHFMPAEMFERAVRSLGFPGKGAYYGVVGVFGGNPATSPMFSEYCEVLRRLVPYGQRGLWCNNPVSLERAQEMSRTFDPSVSNLNVHLDRDAYDLFKLGWPGCSPVGLATDSRHSPVHLAMRDVLRVPCPKCYGAKFERGPSQVGLTDRTCSSCDGVGTVPDDARIWQLVSGCDINQHWSAMLGMFRGELRAWFCEVAGAQSILHQDDPSYPDTGVDPTVVHGTGECPSHWWELPMNAFRDQVRKHCFECGVPLRGYGQLAQGSESQGEQTSPAHRDIFKPKRPGRQVEVVTDLVQLGVGRVQSTIQYLQNSRR